MMVIYKYLYSVVSVAHLFSHNALLASVTWVDTVNDLAD